MDNYTIVDIESFPKQTIDRFLIDNGKQITSNDDHNRTEAISILTQQQRIAPNDANYTSYWLFPHLYKLTKTELNDVNAITPSEYKKSMMPRKDEIVTGYIDFETKQIRPEYTSRIVSFYNQLRVQHQGPVCIPYLYQGGSPASKEALIKKLVLNGIYRGLPILSMDYNALCSKLEEQLPSQRWVERVEAIMKDLRTTHPTLYKHYRDYVANPVINAELRANPAKRGPLDDIFNMLPPLDKDIIVYRYINCSGVPINQMIDMYGHFKSYGYLSTTINNGAIAGNGKTVDNAPITCALKIHVPAGKKAIYAGDWQGELLFPHNIVLNVLHQGKTQLPILSGERLTAGREIDYYEMSM